VSWKTNGGSPIGPVAFATDGTAFVAFGPGTVTAGGYANAIVALDPKTLAVKDWFARPGIEFAAPPVLFQEAGKDIVAATTRDGRIVLLDAGSLGGPNHETPLFASASLTGGAATFGAHAPAMWQERAPVPSATAAATAPTVSSAPASPDGPRWLLIPVAGPLPAGLGAAGHGAVTSGAILGVRVEHHEGRFSVHPRWVSQNIASPLTPIVVNGVAFAASGPSNAPAALYALHGASGQPLWNSGKTITSALSGRSFWAGSGHVFVGTREGTVYAFGFAYGTEVARPSLHPHSHVESLSDNSSVPGRRALLRILSRAAAPARSQGASRRRHPAQGAGQAQATTSHARDQPVDARWQAGSGKLRSRHSGRELRDSADGKGDGCL
jgi:outer membrane protein assembly factor BamB